MAFMTPTIAAAAAGMLLLAGCAIAPTEPPPRADHPANPNAAESPLPARSPTLALDEPAPQPLLTESRPAMEHGATDAGMRDMAGMHHHGGGMPGLSHEPPPTQPGENAALSAPRWTPTTAPTTVPATSPNAGESRGTHDHASHGGQP